MRKLNRIALICTLCCCILMGTAQGASIGGARTTTALRLRTGAGTWSEIVDVLDTGTAVIVEQDTGTGWYQVNYKGQRGYMSARYLNFSKQHELTATGRVSGSGVRLRSGPGTNYAILGVTRMGDILPITGVDGNWYRVLVNAKTCYISASYVSIIREGEAAQASSPGQRAVELAKTFMGYSYVWGGNSPSVGFDCSGLVSYVYQSLGYEMNRTAAQLYQNGSYVNKSELIPGDAVFFGTSASNITHVGMYIGDGEFIHSSSGAGKVLISKLASSYYTRNYVGARRIAV